MHRSLDCLPISSEKKDYIRNKLNPVLEKLVNELLANEPTDPVRHAYMYFRKASGAEDELLLEISALKMKLSAVACISPIKASDMLGIEGKLDISMLDGPSQDEHAIESILTRDERDSVRHLLGQTLLFHPRVGVEVEPLIACLKKVVLESGRQININSSTNDKLIYLVEGSLLVGNVSQTPSTPRITYSIGDIVGLSMLQRDESTECNLTATTDSVLWGIQSHLLAPYIGMMRERFEDFKQLLLDRIASQANLLRAAETVRVVYFHHGSPVKEYLSEADKYYIIASGALQCSAMGQPVATLERGSLVIRDDARDLRSSPNGCQLYVLRKDFVTI